MQLVGRTEKRMTMEVSAYLAGPEESGGREAVVIENVSGHGARVLAQQRRECGQQMQLLLGTNELCGGARVVYCQPGPEGQFFLGLQLKECAANWWKSEKSKRAAEK